MDGASVDPQLTKLSKFYLYSTAARYYLVGRSKDGRWVVLTLVRGAPPVKGTPFPGLEAHETTSSLSQVECAALLRQIHAGNSGKSGAGLQLVCKAYGVIGCFQFLEGHYLLLITKRTYQGNLCGHKVYSISDTALVPLVQASGQGQESNAERRYRKLLLGMDLAKDFFFSYTYNIAATLQKNMTSTSQQDRFDSMFVWNQHLTRPLREALGNDRWVVPLIHGFWQQRTLAVFGQTLTITLVARRSRHFAGTRYQKRGVNHEGRVANDVETEQIVWAGLNRRHASPSLSSFVQARGSIPLYWSQQGSRLSKPDILLQNFDPLYNATRMHFDDMKMRYGSPVVCLDLVKAAEKHPREIVLRSEFDTAISYINQTEPAGDEVLHLPFDLNFHAKQQGSALLETVLPLLDRVVDSVGLFVHKSADGPQVMQRGVLRTNCIDCLDRTNVAQFAAGLAALGHQLEALGISDSPSIDAHSSLARHLMDLYEATGNTLARQYGGSEAHSTFFQRQRGDWEPAMQSRDLMTSIRRFYSNAYTDAEKQAAINLFLGNFVPRAGRPALWDLDSDYYLHYSSGTALKQANNVLSRAASAETLQPSKMSGGSGSLWRFPDAGAQSPAGQPPLGTPLSPGRRHSLDGSSAGLQVSRMLAEEAAAADVLKRTAQRNRPRPSAIAGHGRVGSSERTSPLTTPRATAQSLTANLNDGVGSPLSPGSVRGAGPLEYRLPASEFDESQPTTPVRPEHISAAAEQEERLPTSAAAAAGAREASVAPTRRRAKLESLEKLIGQQPDVVHHVRLHAAPSHRAYLPQWLAAPLGRRRPAEGPEPFAASKATLPPIAEHGAGGSDNGTGSIRRVSADFSSHTKIVPLPRRLVSGVRRTQSTDSGLLRLVRSAQNTEHKVSGGQSPTLRIGNSFWELGLDWPLFDDSRSDALPVSSAGPCPPSPPLQQQVERAPVTAPALALTDMVASERKSKVEVTPPSIGSFLSSGPSNLGISPFLMAWWLSSEEHLSAWFAAEAALVKHYKRFIADTQSFAEPTGLRVQYDKLCTVPLAPLVNGI